MVMPLPSPTLLSQRQLLLTMLRPKRSRQGEGVAYQQRLQPQKGMAYQYQQRLQPREEAKAYCQ